MYKRQLQDKSGRIQIYARRDEMDEEAYNRFQKFDIGDIVGVRGEVFRTQKGEMSIREMCIRDRLHPHEGGGGTAGHFAEIH